MNILKKQLYQLIKENETVFDFIQEQAVNGLWFWSLEDLNKKWVNPAFCEALGYEVNCIDSSILSNIVYEKDKPVLDEVYTSLFENKDTIDKNKAIRFYHKDGSIVWFSFSFLLIKDQNQSPTHVIIGHKEVTHKNVNSLINRYELILNNHSTFIIRTDLEGKYTYANDYFCTCFGLEKKNIIGQDSMDSIVVEDHLKCREAVINCIQNPEQSYFSMIRKPLPNGQIAYTEWEYKAITNAQNEVEEIQCVGIEVTEKVKAEQKREENTKQLVRTQRLLASCNKNTQVGVWELDLKTGFSQWDKIVKEIHEVDDDFVSDIKLGISFYTEEDQKRIAKYVAIAIQKGKKYDDEFQITTYKGNKKWVRTTGTPIMKDGKCVDLYGTFQDVTQQKQIKLNLQQKINELEKAQQEIQKIKERYEFTLDNTGIGLWELDLNNQNLYWDKQAQEIFGVNVTNPIGRAVARTVISEEDIEEIDANLELMIQGKLESYEKEYRTVVIKGEARFLHTRAVLMRDENQNPMRIVGIIQNITKQKEYERIVEEQNKELANSEEEMRKNIREMYHLQQNIFKQKLQLEQIFDAVPAMIYQFRRDNEGNISFPLVSRGSEIILGVKATEILNQNSSEIFEAIHPNDLLGFRSSIKQSVETMQKWESELRLLKNGKEVWIHATSKPTHMDNGGIVWTGIMQNINHIKQTEFKVQEKNKQLLETLSKLQETQSQLIHNEKMTTLGQLVASIAHEINTPLGAIQSSSKSIEKNVG